MGREEGAEVGRPARSRPLICRSRRRHARRGRRRRRLGAHSAHSTYHLMTLPQPALDHPIVGQILRALRQNAKNRKSTAADSTPPTARPSDEQRPWQPTRRVSLITRLIDIHDSNRDDGRRVEPSCRHVTIHTDARAQRSDD